MKPLEIFIDIISPYAYLGLELFSRHALSEKLEFTITPVALGSILNVTGNPGPANIAPKRKVALLDFCMQCALYEIPAQGPPQHPFNPMPVLRFLHCIDDQDLRLRAALWLNKACWADGLAVDDEDAISLVLSQSDFYLGEWGDISALIKEKRARKAVKLATARAVELDVFGVPTFRYDGINFWGSDRLELLAAYIEAPDKFNDTHYSKMLNTPSGF